MDGTLVSLASVAKKTATPERQLLELWRARGLQVFHNGTSYRVRQCDIRVAMMDPADMSDEAARDHVRRLVAIRTGRPLRPGSASPSRAGSGVSD